MNTRFIVLQITTYGDAEEDPEKLANNLAYPEIVQYVEDEEEPFCINPVTRKFYAAKDFFQEVYTEAFTIE